jgi:hypothetical protein
MGIKTKPRVAGRLADDDLDDDDVERKNGSAFRRDAADGLLDDEWLAGTDRVEPELSEHQLRQHDKEVHSLSSQYELPSNRADQRHDAGCQWPADNLCTCGPWPVRIFAPAEPMARGRNIIKSQNLLAAIRNTVLEAASQAHRLEHERARLGAKHGATSGQRPLYNERMGPGGRAYILERGGR